jgi:hypothetical protein
VIELYGAGFHAFAADLAPMMSQSGADTVIGVGGTNSVTLKNVVVGELSADHFKFV